MREHLIQYVNLLFAGAPDSDDVRQEILQNTLDRYYDLVSQGKSPEAAYRLAISGIGDINEILGNAPLSSVPNYPSLHPRNGASDFSDTPEKKTKRAVAVAMYILCPVPLFILSEFRLETLGLCFTLLLVAAATVMMILNQKKSAKEPTTEEFRTSPRHELHKSVNSFIWAIGLAIYFILSFATSAWYITWIIFPITASVQGLVKACMDLKEASKYEN